MYIDIIYVYWNINDSNMDSNKYGLRWIVIN